MAKNPREAAICALCKIDKDGEYSNKAVLEELSGMEPRDRALANELIMGVMRNRIYIDFVIQSYSKIKLKKLSPWVLQILRCGVYQMTDMNKIPPSAACNEAVKLASKYAHKAARGYVNGVLRTVSRSLDSLPEPQGSFAERISVKYSCPLWLTEKLIKQFGRGTCEKILKDSLLPHPAMIRANILKTNADELTQMLRGEGICAKPDAEVKQCLRISGAIDIKASRLYGDGYYTLQNINSMRAALALEPKSGETVLDLCAAPGGKTTHIAELMKNEGRIIAFDIHKHKLELIQRSAERLGIDCIEVKEHNSEEPIDELKGAADRVLADVPCSGIGVIHKKPDIKYNRSAMDIEALCKIQRNILNSAAGYVKTGGVLVYSTCTILEEENERQIERFLAEHTDFKCEFEKLYLAYEGGGSGFYICRMIKFK